MKTGKHVAAKTAVKMPKIAVNKKLALIISVCLLAAITVGATLAYLVDRPDGLVNTFTPSHVDSEVEEDVSGGVKSSVQIRNIGDIDAWIRVAVVANTVDENGDVTGPADVSASLAGEGWEKYGNYYYWTKPVAPNALTGELLAADKSISLEGVQVTIMSDAIQANPAKAVGEAWGVVIAENSVTAYTAE